MESFTRWFFRTALAMWRAAALTLEVRLKVRLKVGLIPHLTAGAAARLAAVLAVIVTVNAAATAPVILIFGDSLSAEYGLTRGAGWAALLEKRLTEKQMNYSVANASISGETSSGGAARIDTVLRQTRPAIVVIELGGNDGLRGLALDATRANFEKIITASQAAGAKVLLAGMQLPPNYGPAYTGAFRALYANLAARHKTALVPFFLAGVAEKRELFQTDGIHPVAQAQGMLLDNVWPSLAPLLGKAAGKAERKAASNR